MIRSVTFLLLCVGSILNISAANTTYSKESESLAKKGNIEAMLQMGEYYATLQPATYDNAKKAASWYKKAMEKGSQAGRFRYAEIMADGSTGKVNHKDAIKAVTGITNDSVAEKFFKDGMKSSRNASGQALLYCSATMGFSPAFYELALLYEDNAMLIKKEWKEYNIIKAIQLMEEAGSRGFIPAIYWVIDAYSTKRKEPENVTKWKNRLYAVKANQVNVNDAVFAQNHNDTKSIVIIYDILSRNKSYTQNIVLAQEATMLLSKSNCRHALKPILNNMPVFKNSISYTTLKKIIEDYDSDVTDNENILLIGIENNDPDVMRRAAETMLKRPAFRPSSRNKIESFLKKSADDGNKSDALLIADMLCNVEPTDERRTEAVKYYTASGSEHATNIIGNLALNYELTEAIDFIKKKANLNDADAQGWLGKMYATGKGVQKDLKEARKWLNKAEQNGKPKYKQECSFAYPSAPTKNPAKHTKSTGKSTTGVEFQQSKQKR